MFLFQPYIHHQISPCSSTGRPFRVCLLYTSLVSSFIFIALIRIGFLTYRLCYPSSLETTESLDRLETLVMSDNFLFLFCFTTVECVWTCPVSTSPRCRHLFKIPVIVVLGTPAYVIFQFGECQIKELKVLRDAKWDLGTIGADWPSRKRVRRESEIYQ